MSTSLASYSDLVPYLTAQLDNIPDGVALQCIRKGAIQFARDTGTLIQDLAPMQAVAYQQSYTLATAQDMLVQRLVSCRVFGHDMRMGTFQLMGTTLLFSPNYAPVDTETIAAYNASVPYQVAANVTHGTADAYEIYAAVVGIPTPESWTPAHWRIDYNKGIRIRAALQPNDSSAGVPAWYLNKYRMGLEAAGLMFALMQAEKPWTPAMPRGARRAMTPPALAEAQSQYRHAVHDAKVDTAFEGTSAPAQAAIHGGVW